MCVNPATRPQAADVIEMVTEMVDEGNEVMPGIGGDIADPDVVESAYPGTPLRALLSFQTEGLAPMADRYGELTMPALIITSRQDHVVDPSDSEHLAASLGGDRRSTCGSSAATTWPPRTTTETTSSTWSPTS